ncbi:IS607 family element RNA-guided endonuclease TnpB, partial [Kitasatospora sp. NPDC093558]|uniref:IS607 family element RNA-guided endonuclease TnpB n=1 Tax=Kitasatospora sp. NPDC093558 TaxID=3155201 RepID=UPI00343D4296
MVQAYRFALDPNSAQEAALRSHCGAARAAYNWAVSWVAASWWQRRAEASYGVAEADLTPWRPWSLPVLRKVFNEVKKSDPRFAGWWEENSKEAYSTGLANAAAAFDNYSRSKRGERKGKAVGMPRFKSKHGARLSCRFTTGTIRVDVDRRHVTLPRLGTIRTHESTRKLERRLANGSARILSATVRHERGRWFVSFQTEVKKTERTAAHPDVAVGVDLGVKCLAVMADSLGEARFEPNPRHLDRALKRLRRASRRVCRRQGPDRRKGVKPSKRWLRANDERNRVHYRVANLRMDALHKLTTAITSEYGTVVVEDLNVAGMLRNRRLARKIQDAGFGEIRRQIAYKTGWTGGRVIVADRWYPSSKTCSACKAVKAKLPLPVRVFTCDACGLVIDRDENAARNLAGLASGGITGTGVAGDP